MNCMLYLLSVHIGSDALLLLATFILLYLAKLSVSCIYIITGLNSVQLSESEQPWGP